MRPPPWEAGIPWPVAAPATVPDHSYPEITERRSTSSGLFDPDGDDERDDPDEDDRSRDGNRTRGGAEAGDYSAGSRAVEKESVGENAENDHKYRQKREEADRPVAMASDMSVDSLIADVAIGAPHRRRERRRISSHSPQGSPDGEAEANGDNHLHAPSLHTRSNGGKEPPAPDKVEKSGHEQDAEEYAFHAHRALLRGVVMRPPWDGGHGPAPSVERGRWRRGCS